MCHTGRYQVTAQDARGLKQRWDEQDAEQTGPDMAIGVILPNNHVLGAK